MCSEKGFYSQMRKEKELCGHNDKKYVWISKGEAFKPKCTSC